MANVRLPYKGFTGQGAAFFKIKNINDPHLFIFLAIYVFLNQCLNKIRMDSKKSKAWFYSQPKQP